MPIGEIILTAFIKAFLDDAEEKQIENKAVKMWLEELTDLAYDLDDILDEFATEALQLKLIAKSQAASTSKSKLRAMIPTCCKGFNPTTLLSDFMKSSTSKIEEITARLQSIFERGSRLGLQNIVAGESTKAWHRPQSTSSFIHEHCIYGRDKEKKGIIDFLLRDESNDSKVGVIPIVGMGGLGKTTLAQMVYNDEVVNKHFDLKAWVCVSDEFDTMRISKVILESITSKACEFKELNQVQVQKIMGKCKGLPLAARTLSGLLRCKERDDEWEIVLNSKIWDLTEQGNEILPALRLSYHHLPSHLKRCFAYCSILPKDYEFEEEELVFLWMAEGLLQQQNGKK
ncbi:hypothetical protein ACSBR2_017363 [Camellia fascicularis]